MEIPETVAEMCRTDRSAVLVYDVQVGILAHIRDREAVVSRILQVLAAARACKVPVFYARHVSLRPAHMGVAALRTAMAWQRLDQAEEVASAFPPDAAQTQLVDELAPIDGEPVFDKLGMSAFVGTPLEAALRDRRITTLVLVGAVLEIGIEPTARHAADLGLLPVVVTDACGVVEPGAAERTITSLDYSLLSYRATATEIEHAFAESDQRDGPMSTVRTETEAGRAP
jgi:nicotinamidase-related amidase